MCCWNCNREMICNSDEKAENFYGEICENFCESKDDFYRNNIWYEMSYNNFTEDCLDCIEETDEDDDKNEIEYILYY